MLLWRAKLALTSMALLWLLLLNMWQATGLSRWDWDWLAMCLSSLFSVLQGLPRELGPKTLSYEPSTIVSILNSVFSMLGFQLAPAVEDSSKPYLEAGTEPFSPEQEFGEMTLSDYDSDEDADYAPSDSEGSSDDLEYDSGASVSSASES